MEGQQAVTEVAVLVVTEEAISVHLEVDLTEVQG
jgi:hypothetical protein